MDFISLGIALFSSILLQLLTPAPEFAKPKKYGLSDFSLPTATEDRSITLPFGTLPVAGNLVWIGDYQAREITRRVRTGLFSHGNQTLGYKYHVGMWLSLCASTIDSVHGILWGDKDAWKGNLTLSKTAATDLPVDLSYTSNEGQEVPDGLKGVFRFFNQDWPEGFNNSVPIANTYIQTQLGIPTVPAYRGTCHAVFLGPSGGNFRVPQWGFVGSSPNIPSLQIVVKRLPAIWPILQPYSGWLFPNYAPFVYPTTSVNPPGGSSVFVQNFIKSVEDIDGDANPAFVIAELLCARMQHVGPRYTPYALDWDSIMRTAETLKAEGNGVSFAWEESRAVGDVIEDVCKQINGVLQLDQKTGKLHLKLIRESDVPVFEFDSSNVVEFGELERVQLSQAPNEVQVPYTDRSFAYETRTAIAKNPALVQQLGTVVSRTVEHIGVSNARLAGLLATRELRSAAASLAQVRFTATLPVGLILKPADVVTVKHPNSPVALRMRITTGRWNDYSARQQVEFECMEDVFRSGNTSYTSNPALPAPPVYTTSVVANPVLLAAPYALTGDSQDRPLYIAEALDAGARQLRLTTCEITRAWSQEALPFYASDTVTPAISGTLIAAMTSYLDSYECQILLTAGAAAAYGVMQVGADCPAIIEGEWFSAGTTTLAGNTLTLTGLKRGIFDTVPRRHVAGAKVMLLAGLAIGESRMQTRLSESGPSQPGILYLACRADTRGPGGTLFAEDSPSTQATLDAVSTGTSRAVAPLPPAYVRLGGAFGVASILDPVSSITRDAGTQVTWRNRNRLSRLGDSYFVANEDPEPGAFVQHSVDWETTPGSGAYTSNGFTAAAVGATFATVNTTLIPVGARSVRLRIRAARASGSGTAQSTTYDYFFKTLT